MDKNPKWETLRPYNPDFIPTAKEIFVRSIKTMSTRHLTVNP